MSSKKEKFTDLINKNHKRELKDEFDEYGRLIPREYKRNLDHNQLNMSKKFVPGHYRGKVGESEWVPHKKDTLYTSNMVHYEDPPSPQITSISTSDGRQYHVGDVIENLPSGWEYNKDTQSIWINGETLNTQWVDNLGRSTTSPFITTTIPNQVIDTTSDNFKITTNEDVMKQWAEYQKYANENPKDYPNKIDKDLINCKIPYNIKIKYDKTLYYSFALAGYQRDQIKLKVTKDGLLLKLLAKSDEDDLIGDEWEYLCKGIKENNQEVPIFIDVDKYDMSNVSCLLDFGILTIMVKPKLGKEDSIIIDENNKTEFFHVGEDDE